MQLNACPADRASPADPTGDDHHAAPHPAAALPLDQLAARELAEASLATDEPSPIAGRRAQAEANDPAHGLVAASWVGPRAGMRAPGDDRDDPSRRRGRSHRAFWLLISGAGAMAVAALVTAVAITPLSAVGAVGVESPAATEIARVADFDEPPVDGSGLTAERPLTHPEITDPPEPPEPLGPPEVAPEANARAPEKKRRKRKVAPAKPELPATPTRAAVRRAVRNQAAALAPCVRASRRSGELAPGRYTLELSWRVRADGSLSEARLNGPGPLLRSSLARCVPAAMTDWRFPRSREGVAVTRFPFGPFTVN